MKKNQRGCEEEEEEPAMERESSGRERVKLFFKKNNQGYYGLFTSSVGFT